MPVGVVARQVQLAQLGFQDQPVERRADLVRDNRHEVVAHAHRVLQLTLGGTQLGEQSVLFLTCALKRFELLGRMTRGLW